ncbi:MAG: hypothetical protein K2N81_03270, partial [Acetatifactor sp.]|nr:hypothetical protein [Acetatifactor sp.]
MKALKCPSCGADIELDDSREYGFCLYCGTKIQLIEKISITGIKSEQEQLETAKKLINIGEVSEAKILLRKIVSNSPLFGEAWFELSCLLCDLTQKSESYIDFMRGSPKETKQKLYNTLVNSHEYIRTLKLMGDKCKESY